MEATECTAGSATLEPASDCAVLGGKARAPEGTVTALVVCCATPSMSCEVMYAALEALSPVAAVRAVVLSEFPDTFPGVETVCVPPGTKLSKIRRLAGPVEADLICICDPDMHLDAEGCRLVFGRAAAEIRRGVEVVAFGIVEGRDTGSLLSRVVALDKWLSHRVLRRALWGLGVGVTLPGQFLVVSTALLRRLDTGVDSYLDDLYLGWVARSRGASVHRLPVVVGVEDARATWRGLLAQRLRWMKGLARLFSHIAGQPSAAILLAIHYLAYHGLPILLLSSLAVFSVVSPILAAAAFFAMTILLSRLSGHSCRTTAAFLIAFPLVHCLVSLLWWVPASRSYLARR